MATRPPSLTDPVTDDLSKTARLLVSDKVRALLARQGISDPQQQLATLMTLMNASHSQVYRKLSGRSSWLEEDLLCIATHFGETMGTLFRDEADKAVSQTSSDAQGPDWLDAKVQVGGQLLACRVALAAPGATPGQLALIDTPQGPVVDAPSSNLGSLRGFVRALRLDIAAEPQGGIAVFDDDPDVADAIVDTLLSKGLDAQAFYAKEDLQASPRRFDTYILDWFSSATSTTADLITHLRTRHAPHATIVVLTGQIQRDKAESDLSRLILTHDVMVELKPMRLDLLLAKIEHARHEHH